MNWHKLKAAEEIKDYFIQLKSFLERQYQEKKVIYPPAHEVYQAFDLTPFNEVKVIILGQDPYHGQGQAHGLAFSVKKGVKLPPSLRNIFKELENDLQITLGPEGNLTAWAQQGVLLLNTVLTVEEGRAGSHHKKGWEFFTDTVIKLLDEELQDLVFVLWGAPAQTKKKLINSSKHLIIEAPHPSPLSSYRGFFGSKPFSKINEHLQKVGKAPIDWRL